MANIELPTYRTIIRNELFGRAAEPMQDSICGELAATQITLLRRFRVPTQDEVIDFIRTNAKGIDTDCLEKGKTSMDDSEIIHVLKFMPASEIKDIARGDQKSLEHLKQHSLAMPYLQESGSYLASLNGIVPNQVLDSARKLASKEGIEIYEQAMETTGIRNWDLTVKLLENKKFPDSLELEYLLYRGVRDSDVFTIRGDFGNYQSVANHVRLLYLILDSPELIAQIKDTSNRYLEQSAMITIRRTIECLTTERHLKKELSGLIKELGGLMGKISERKPTLRNFLRDCGSYN